MKNVLITLTMSALMLGSTVTVAVTERSALDEYLKKEQWQAVTLPAPGALRARLCGARDGVHFKAPKRHHAPAAL